MADLGIYALMSLFGAGVMLNHTKDNPEQKQQQHKNQQSHYQQAKNTETALVTAAYQKSQSPMVTGIIPRYYNTLNIGHDVEKFPNKDYNPDLVNDILRELTPEDRETLVSGARERAGSGAGSLVYSKSAVAVTAANANPNERDPATVEQIGGSLIPGNTDMTHLNMVPFYKGTLTQDVQLDNRDKAGKLELYTGQFKLNSEAKKELGQFFAPTADMSRVNGHVVHRPDDNRFKPSNTGKKHGETPTDSVRVGPGLNNGYTNLPSGGFHSALRIMPKSVTELYVDPVVESKARVKTGGSHIAARGLHGQVRTYKPKVMVTNLNGERNMKTTGAVTGRRLRPSIVLRNTRRDKSRQLIGAAGGGEVKAHRIAPKSQLSKRLSHLNTPFRNLISAVTKIGDFKSSYTNKPNSRMVTGVRRRIGIARGAEMAKVRQLDPTRQTRKEYYTDNSRVYGNSKISVPGRGPAYNPAEWAAKKTIRETTENSDHTGFLSGIAKRLGIYMSPAKVTVKETTVNNDYLGQANRSTYRPKAALTDKARRTIRETTENSGHLGQASVSSVQRRTATPSDKARRTIKETTENAQYDGQIGGQVSRHLAAPADAARRTIRETTEDSQYGGQVSGQVARNVIQSADQMRQTIRETTEVHEHQGWVGANTVNAGTTAHQDKARKTTKETTVDNDYLGITGTLQRKHIVINQDRAKKTVKETTEQSDYLAPVGTLVKRQIAGMQDRARRTIRETTEDNNHLGQAKGDTKRTAGPQDRARRTIKETTELDGRVGGVQSGTVQNGGGYMTNPKEMRNTNRQFTSDNAYTGIAESSAKGNMSHEDVTNARFNVNREKVLRSRAPTAVGAVLGHQETNISVRKRDSDRQNNYTRVKSTTLNNIYNPEITITSEKNHLPEHDRRLDTSILDAYKKNPLTQPLDSYY